MAPPEGWNESPGVADGLIENIFFAFKTPLKSSNFDVNYILNYARQNQWNIGLWVDLTNTTRYYNPQDVQMAGVKYEKLMLVGREGPSKYEVGHFISSVQSFRVTNPSAVIGIHCTHGFNRTGFLICAYLCKVMKLDPHEALSKFRQMRPPGIYRQNMVDDLCQRFSTTNAPPPVVLLPTWKSPDKPRSRKGKKSNIFDDRIWYDFPITQPEGDTPCLLPPPTIDTRRRLGNSVPDVSASKRRSSTRWNTEPVIEAKKPIGIQEALQKCSVLIPEDKAAGLLESVASMCLESDITKKQLSMYQRLTAQSFPTLKENSYVAAWYPSQSFRSFLCTDAEGEIYFIDHALRVRYMPLLNLPDSTCFTGKMTSTLIEGLLVERKVSKASTETKLCFEITDVLVHKGRSLDEEDFLSRLIIARENIIGERKKLAAKSPELFSVEPFSLNILQFWRTTNATKLLQFDLKSIYTSDPKGFLFIPTSMRKNNGEILPKFEWTGTPTMRAHFRLQKQFPEHKRYSLSVDDEVSPVAELQAETKDKSEFDRLVEDESVIECTLDIDKKWKYVRKSARNYSDPKTLVDDILNGDLRKNMSTACVFEFFNSFKARPSKVQPVELPGSSGNPPSSSTELHDPETSTPAQSNS